MTRILELTPSSEESVISRVLLLVHQAVDENFPAAEKPGRQFTKTVFSDDGYEKTGLMPIQFDPRQDIIVPQEIPPMPSPPVNTGATESIPPPPPPPPPLAPAKISLTSQAIDSFSEPKKAESFSSAAKKQPISSQNRLPMTPGNSRTADQIRENIGPTSKRTPDQNYAFSKDHGTSLEETFNQMETKVQRNWVTLLTLALLLAGCVLLVYVVLF